MVDLRGFVDELRLSVLLVTGVLAALATVLVAASELAPPSGERMPLYAFCIGAYLAAAGVWLLDRWGHWVGRAVALALLLGAVYGGAYALDLPAMLTFAGTATIVAAALLGTPAAVATAAAEMVLLVIANRARPTLVGGPSELAGISLAVRLAAIAVTFGLIQTVFRRMRGVALWSWEHFEAAQRALAETRERKAELEQALDDLVYANRQLALANERIATLRAAAEEAQKAKTTFVARVSHEFRTPLNMIIGLVSLMIDSPEIYAVDISPDMRRDLQIVNRNCEHLARMVNDVLNLTQIEAGRLVLHRERFELREAIVGAVTAVRPLLEKKGLALTEEIPDDLPLVYCDRTRIQQVILNLVSNAARFTEEGGISIGTIVRESDVVVMVRDTGPGILPEDRERIFEPFTQGSTELWRETGGSGLGLAISRQFIEAHGGRIWLESERGVGTTFYFSLPVSGPLAPAAPASRWIVPDWPWRERRTRATFGAEHYRPRVIVQDATGALHEELLRRGDEVDMVSTPDVAETVAALEACPAHVVIVNAAKTDDLLALVEAVRQQAPTTPVLGCTVPPVTAGVAAARATGYLVKPVSRADLLGAVRAAGPAARRVLLVDDDPDVRQLYTRTLQSADPALEITTAASGPEALAQLHDGAMPDVVLLDIFMRGMDGWEVLAALRDEPLTADLPVFLVSAHDPAEKLPGSRLLLGALGDEISIPKLLTCSLALSRILLSPDGMLDPEPPPTPEAEPAWTESLPPRARRPAPPPE